MGNRDLSDIKDDSQRVIKEAGAIIRKFVSLHPEFELYENYSGRFMYGRKCIGFVCDNEAFAMSEFFKFVIVENKDQDIVIALSDMRNDELGLQKIIYFPNIN